MPAAAKLRVFGKKTRFSKWKLFDLYCLLSVIIPQVFVAFFLWILSRWRVCLEILLRPPIQRVYRDSAKFTRRWAQNINMDVSENSGTPKSSILIGFSNINHPFWGPPIFGNTHMKGFLSQTDAGCGTFRGYGSWFSPRRKRIPRPQDGPRKTSYKHGEMTSLNSI